MCDIKKKNVMKYKGGGSNLNQLREVCDSEVTVSLVLSVAAFI